MALKKETLEEILKWDAAKNFALGMACTVFFSAMAGMVITVLIIQHGGASLMRF